MENEAGKVVWKLVISSLEIPLLAIWNRQWKPGWILNCRIMVFAECRGTVFLERDVYLVGALSLVVVRP